MFHLGAEDKGVVVGASIHHLTLPRVFPHLDIRGDHLRVLFEEVWRQEQREVFRRRDLLVGREKGKDETKGIVIMGSYEAELIV